MAEEKETGSDLVAVYFTRDEAESFSDAIADVIQWMFGFEAAKKRAVKTPTNWEMLRELNIKLKRPHKVMP